MQINFTRQHEGQGALVLATLDSTFPESYKPIKSRALIEKHLSNYDKLPIISTLTAPLDDSYHHIILLNIKNGENLNCTKLEELGAKLYLQLVKMKVKALTLDLRDCLGEDEHQKTAHLLAGLRLRSFTFHKYKTKEPVPPTLQTIFVITDQPKESKAAYLPLEAQTKGVFTTRELVSEPPNRLYPKTAAEAAQKLTKFGLEVEVLDEKALEQLGMHALLGVGQGSRKPPRLVIVKWQNSPHDEAPLAFVGKGVTFDTGGISLKPSGGMDEMKSDMAGAGVVFGLMKTLALRKAPVNVIGIMGFAENMPDGNAQRPADIVHSMSGQTIEVLNTDAEGRLLLADALWYTATRYAPKLMVDIATLTGAIVIALGSLYAGLFSNNDSLASELLAAGVKTGEKLWRLPLDHEYNKRLDSDIADVKNISAGREAGSITAAQFLERFVKDVPWAHLDIAATAWSTKNLALSARGATGFGVRLLDNFIKTNYET
ncbi:MAG: putative leucyl aminopeptidase PepA [Bacillota bacterium]|jgi:leucyl aminopeptidase